MIVYFELTNPMDLEPDDVIVGVTETNGCGCTPWNCILVKRETEEVAEMFIILQPESNTNHSKDYLVVDSKGWQRFANGAATSYAIASRHRFYPNAEDAKNELNKLAQQN